VICILIACNHSYVVCAAALAPCLDPVVPQSSSHPTVIWNIYGTIVTYICPPGWYFADGGTRRSLGCI